MTEDERNRALAYLLALFDKPGEFFFGDYITEKIRRVLLEPQTTEWGLDPDNHMRYEEYLEELRGE